MNQIFEEQVKNQVQYPEYIQSKKSTKNNQQFQETVKPVLTKMMQDADRDVKYFAEKSLVELDNYFESKA